MSDRLHVRTIHCIVIEPQHTTGGIVDVLQATLVIDDQHAFHHARENSDHARAVARKFVDSTVQLTHRAVKATRDLANVVVAVVGRWPSEISNAVAPRNFEDALDASL